jgi:MFS family permease
MAKRIFYGWWIVLACFIISLFIGAVIFFGFTAFFEPIREEFGWSSTQVSFAASLRGLEMGLLAPLVGFLVDRFGSRKLLLCGTTAVGFGLVLLSRTQSLLMFYASFLLLAFGAGGCTSVVTMTAVANWFHKKVGIALGIMASGFGASGLLVPFIVSLIDLYGWRVTLVILGLAIWFIGLPLCLVIRDKPEQYGYHPDGEGVEHLGTKGEGAQINIKEVLRNRSFLCLNIVEIIRMLATIAVVTHIMPYLGSIGIPRTTAGLVAAGVPLCSMIGRFGFGWLGDVFDKRQMMAAAFFCLGAGVLTLCFAQAIWAIILFLLLFPCGFGGMMVLRGSIIREYFGRALFSKMIGIILGSASVGGIIGPTLAGWVFDTSGSYHFVWLLFSGLVGLAIGLVWRIK